MGGLHEKTQLLIAQAENKTKENTILLGIEENLAGLNVHTEKFDNPLPELVQKLCRFLEKYEVSLIDFQLDNRVLSADRLLLGLCLVDTWITTAKSNANQDGPTKLENYTQLKSITDRFKLLCVVRDDETRVDTQLSKRVLHQAQNSQKRESRANFFDPKQEYGSCDRKATDAAFLKIKNDYTDVLKSAFVNQNLLTLYPDFQEIITAHTDSNKSLFEIVVLTLTTEEFKNIQITENEKLGGIACVYRSSVTGQNTVFVCGSSPSFDNDLEHEITHALSNDSPAGITQGYNSTIGKGANEGLTEENTKNPAAYREQRDALYQIFQGYPELKALAYEVYFGKKPRHSLTTALLNVSGSEGVIKFWFMTSVPKNNLVNILKSILYDAPDTAQYFSQDASDASFAAPKLTAELSAKFWQVAADSRDIIGAERPTELKDWELNYGMSLQIIGLCLKLIVYSTQNTPLWFVLPDVKIRKEYEDFLGTLQDFILVENEDTKIQLNRLVETGKWWSDFIKDRTDRYWLDDDESSVFDGSAYQEFLAQNIEQPVTPASYLTRPALPYQTLSNIRSYLKSIIAFPKQ